MTNDPTINQLNRKGFVLNWLAVIRNQRIIKDTFLVVVIVLLVVWVILLLGKVNDYEWAEEKRIKRISDQASEIRNQKDVINNYEKDILMYQDTLREDDRLLIIGELEPPEAVK